MQHIPQRRKILAALAGVGLLGGLPLIARAGTFPQRPVKLIVPYPAGGVVDVAARIIADDVAQRWDQPIVVENRAGANGNIGADLVKHAKPDGYTLLVGSMFVVINPLIDKASRYATQDFDPIVGIGSPPNLLVVPASSPATSLEEFVQLARNYPGKFNTPNPGVGSSNHLGLELFMQESGVDLVQVNYKGQPPFLVELINGQLQFAYLTTALALPHIQTGKLRALAVVSHQRLKALPEIPTLAEAGYSKAIVLPWNGLLAPAGTPEAVRDRIAAEVSQSLRKPGVIQRYEAMSAEIPEFTQNFSAFVQAEKTRWTKLVAERKITTQGLL